MQLFIKRYICTIAYAVIGYAIFLFTLFFYGNPFEKFYYYALILYIFFLLMVRALDDYKDYYEDFIRHKTLFKRGQLLVLTSALFLGYSTLVIIRGQYFYFIPLGILCVYFFINHFIFRVAFIPVLFTITLYYDFGFHWSNVIILSLALIGSILFGIHKKKKVTTSISEHGGKGYHLYQMEYKNTPPFIVIPVSALTPWNEEMINAYILSFCKKNKKYAVRSSSTLEDGDKYSFAGVHESYLNIPMNEIKKHVRLVVESASSERALEYRRRNHLENEKITIAVVIQEMVHPDFAGVLFEINPASNNTFESVVSVCRGLGDKLVDGSVDGTTYYVSGSDIKCKGEDILSSKQIKNLMKLKDAISKKCDAFQDIEFAIKGNKAYFLQTRDITTHSMYKKKELSLLIDNSNIIESYYGVTSPLTFSFAKEIYEKVYTETLKLGKVSKKTLDVLKPSLSNMLYSYEGKIYYNIFSWYHVTSIFPSKNTLGYMESMMGVKSKSSGYKKVKLTPYGMLKIGVILITKFKHMEELSNAFKKRFDEIVLPYYGKELHLTNEECIKLYQQIDSEIIKEFTTPILNDVAVMFYFGSLKRKAAKYEARDEIISEAMNNHGNVESAGSAGELAKIIEYIQSHDEIRRDFKRLSEDELYLKYHNNKDTFSEMLNGYIHRFGSRVMNELKLETITMIEDNLLLYKALKTSLDTPSFTTSDKKNVIIPKKLKRLSIQTKKYVQNRESLRLRRTYIFSVVRNIFLNLGRNFKSEGRIDDERDIFYLTKDEIFGLYPNYKAAVFLRKGEEGYYMGRPYYDRIAFYSGKPLPVVFSKAKDGISGIPSGNGIVSGYVSVMENVNSKFTPGNIILAKRTDPGWISLFPMAKGLIVEHGSMLSHSFVVAREMGLPAIVSVTDATKWIHDGDYITLDAMKGVITIEK